MHNEETNTKLSNQAIATLMVTLQKCLLEQSDITQMLKDYDFNTNNSGELIVVNPPTKMSIGTTDVESSD